MTGPLRMLTVHQPWAELIAAGAKRVDTRSAPTPYRGPVAIHAARATAAYWRIWDTGHRCPDTPEAAIVAALVDGVRRGEVDDFLADEPVPFGAVVAVADLEWCAPIVWAAEAPTSVTGLVVLVDGTARLPHRARARLELARPNAQHWRRPDRVDLSAEVPLGDFSAGRWAWGLARARRVDPPVPCRGGNGLVRAPDVVVTALAEAAR